MKKHFLIYLLPVLFIFLTGCHNKKADEQKTSKQVNLSTEKTTNEDSFIVKENLSEENPTEVKIHENCYCNGVYASPKEHLKFNDDLVELCSFDYDSVSGVTYEFGIFDKNKKLMFEGSIPSLFKVKEDKKGLYLIQETELPSGKSNNWKYTPVIRHDIVVADSTAHISSTNIYKRSNLKINRDSVLEYFETQSKNRQRSIENNFAKLFILTLENDTKAMKLMDSINHNVNFDASMGQLQSELSGILELLNKN
ncbi:hypothetical protein OO013_05775 [Mangrovivirga sp. M17]|uniref:Lipoprotein n=1 Tax=Mangrovivirga halotolerans TaxID=2993936 RepID=A0ABT3RPS2_9BACT|nr:hypothetical protein [Mangrovivirga halotolerans]MCX2743364.1 hypothetical protein [Mangrovivirga halotolerans]